MHPLRRKRLMLIIYIMIIIAIVVGLILYALRQNINLFYTPTQIVNNEAPKGINIRVGGLVEQGSFKRESDSLKSEFSVTDTQSSIIISYEGILPDLFREGQGVVARGQLTPENHFVAEEVLAKHDENYMPPEVKEALEAQGYWKHDQQSQTTY